MTRATNNAASGHVACGLGFGPAWLSCIICIYRTTPSTVNGVVKVGVFRISMISKNDLQAERNKPIRSFAISVFGWLLETQSQLGNSLNHFCWPKIERLLTAEPY